MTLWLSLQFLFYFKNPIIILIKIFFSIFFNSFKIKKKKKNQIFDHSKFCSCEILFVSRYKEYYIVEAKIGHVKLRRIRLKAVNTWAGRGEERSERTASTNFQRNVRKREYVCVCACEGTCPLVSGCSNVTYLI